jgi:nucleoside-specific outer membrane channel protein Tsx
MWNYIQQQLINQRTVKVGQVGVLIMLLLIVSTSFAGSASWSSTNIEYLRGSSYELGDETRSIFTLEHVNGWKYGDNFFFVDVTNPDSNGDQTATSFYSEFSPRFSLSALTGKDFKSGIINDYLITTTLEMGEGFHTYLYGLAVDLNVSTFKVFQINWYIRNEIAATDTGNQLTLVWNLPFKVASNSMVFEGFFDYAYGVDPSENNIITAPRLLIDVGDYFGVPGELQAGIEYQIWRNKFGIDGVDEDVAQAMLKWIW